MLGLLAGCEKARTVDPKDQMIRVGTTSSNVCPVPLVDGGEPKVKIPVTATVFALDGQVAPNESVLFSATAGKTTTFTTPAGVDLSDPTVKTDQTGRASVYAITDPNYTATSTAFQITGKLLSSPTNAESSATVYIPKSPTMTLNASAGTVARGAAISYDIGIVDACYVGGMQATVTWDPAQFTLTAISEPTSSILDTDGDGTQFKNAELVSPPALPNSTGTVTITYQRKAATKFGTTSPPRYGADGAGVFLDLVFTANTNATVGTTKIKTIDNHIYAATATGTGLTEYSPILTLNNEISIDVTAAASSSAARWP